MNGTTLACNVTLSDGTTQTSTGWYVQNFQGNPGLQSINIDFGAEIFSVGGDPLPNDPTRTFRNRLTVLNFAAELDRVTVFCGTGGSAENREQAIFYFRVYSKLLNCSGHGMTKFARLLSCICTSLKNLMIQLSISSKR